MEAVVVAAVMAAWVGLAAGCDWASRRSLAPPKVKPAPEPMVSSNERVAAHVKDDSELEAELAVRR